MILFEALFVGLYTSSIFAFVGIIKKYISIHMLYFVTGFIKHFLAKLINIHSYYCKNSCNAVDTSETIYQLATDSIIEGLAFILVGMIITIPPTIKIMFIVGLVMHLLAELLGVHKYYCKHRCL